MLCRMYEFLPPSDDSILLDSYQKIKDFSANVHTDKTAPEKLTRILMCMYSFSKAWSHAYRAYQRYIRSINVGSLVLVRMSVQ